MGRIKRIIRKSIFYVGYISHYNHDSKVIYYHDVGKKYTDMGTDYALMQKHFDVIRQCGYKIVPEISESEYQVMICFDDGWAGIYDYKDELIRQQIFPTIFIAVDLIGKNGYLTERQIRELASMGFRFQAHTWSHQDLTTFDDGGLEHELKESKDRLEEMFSHSFYAICFPMGRFSSSVKRKSLDCGYTELYTSLPGGYFDMKGNEMICRNCAQNSSPSELKWMLNGTSWTFKRKLYRQHYQK